MHNNNETAHLSFLKRLPALYVGIALCFLTGIFWWFLAEQRNTALHQIIETKSEHLASYIERDMHARIPALQRMVRRMENRGSNLKDDFLPDAENYIKDLPGFQALEWVDSRFHVRWITPLKGNEKAQDLNLAFEPRRLAALKKARDLKQPSMTKPISLVQGGTGFLIYFPIYINNTFDGFILAVFNSELWLSYALGLRETEEEIQNYRIRVHIEEQHAYTQVGWDEDLYTNWQTTSDVQILDNNITLAVRPTSHFFDIHSTAVPEIIGVSGLIFSCLITIMIFLSQKTLSASAKLRSANFGLEAAMEERTKAEQEAHRANQAKSEFLSSMSHELRTPLNAILGFGQLLEIDAIDKTTRENSQEIINAGNHLLVLINEILDLAKIEAGKITLNIQELPLNKVIHNCLSIIKPLAEKYSIHIEEKIGTTSDQHILVDETRFKQVMLNLLSNAIKYNSDHGSVIIETSSEPNNMLCISVKDTGQGLNSEQQISIFHSFERSNAEQSHIEGAGLGLSISRQLMELMDGEIGVESSPGKGSRFWITLKLA